MGFVCVSHFSLHIPSCRAKGGTENARTHDQKTRFVGVRAALIEAAATMGQGFANQAEKSAAARRAVAEKCQGEKVVLAKVQGERFVVLDAGANALPDCAVFEAEAEILWAGERGEIVVKL